MSSFIVCDALADAALVAPAMLSDFWLWQFLGRLHPMIVHFPIGLLFVALVLELLTLNKRRPEFRTAIHILLLIGVISAVAAAVFGWLLKTQEAYSGDVLTIHQWSGIATAVLGLLTLLIHRHMLRTGKPELLKSYRAVLIFTVLGVTVAGHFGASLTHGSDFLTSVLPWNNERSTNFDIAQFGGGNGAKALSAKQVGDLSLEVRSIFAHNCYKCHSAEKTKGELRLDKKEYVMKGGESGDVISAGHPEESEMLRRLLLPREDEDSMPPKGKTLTAGEIATIRLWIQSGAPWPDSLDAKSVYRVAKLEPRMPAMPPATVGITNPVDLFVNRYFKEKKIKWSEPVSDRVYIRRVYLDIIGLLPPPEKIDAFVQDTAPQKREALVLELLGRNNDYAQHWLSFWNDALRNDYSGTGYITGGRFAITEWLYEALRDNKPYDQFVKELVSPDKRSEGFIRGIQWRGTVNASQKVEMQAAQNVSQVFLGLNLKCASCHDSFISDWKLEEAYAFANIFSDSLLEISRCDVPTGKTAGTRIIFTELGTIDSSMSVDDKLEQLATFLTAPKNGRLYRTIVNRIWAQLMGRGIVAPVDLMDNEPWSQDLLDWMAVDFVEGGNDLKDLIFKICTSRTYQQPSVEADHEDDLLAEDYTFRGMHRRRLSAEQFTDAVSTIVHPVYPDTLRYFDPAKNSRPAPGNQPSVSYVRASLVKNDGFLTALGRPNRENVLTSRSSQANLLQALELTNGERFNDALAAGAKKWLDQYHSGAAIVQGVYRMALGREPSAAELKVALQTLGERPDVEAVKDFLWAVMLLPEFQLIF